MALPQTQYQVIQNELLTVLLLQQACHKCHLVLVDKAHPNDALIDLLNFWQVQALPH